jgi:hypothetical protein
MLPLMKIYGMSLVWAGSISLDSTFNGGCTSLPANPSWLRIADEHSSGGTGPPAATAVKPEAVGVAREDAAPLPQYNASSTACFSTSCPESSASCSPKRIRARIFKLLRSPRIDSKESIPPAHVAWRAGTTTVFLIGS